MKVCNSHGQLSQFLFDSNFKVLLAHYVPGLESNSASNSLYRKPSKPLSEEDVQEFYLYETSGWELIAEFRYQNELQ